LGALLSGDREPFEPMRYHDLSGWTNEVQAALTDFAPFEVELVKPDSQIPLSHPLGAAFTGLTTPLTTAELVLLAQVM